MNGRINSEGILLIKKSDKEEAPYIKQLCKYSAEKYCSNKCPFFGVSYKVEKSLYTELKICDNHKLVFNEFEEENFPEKWRTVSMTQTDFEKMLSKMQHLEEENEILKSAVNIGFN